MIFKDTSTGARLFCYKYVLSVYLLRLSCLSSAEAGDGRGAGGGGMRGLCFESGKRQQSTQEDQTPVPGQPLPIYSCSS